MHGQQVAYRADQMLIRLKPEFAADANAKQKVIEALPPNSSLERGFDPSGFAVIRLSEGWDSLVVAQELAARPEVQFAEPTFLESAARKTF